MLYYVFSSVNLNAIFALTVINANIATNIEIIEIIFAYIPLVFVVSG